MTPEKYGEMVERGEIEWEYLPINLRDRHGVWIDSDNFPNLNLLFPEALRALLQKADGLVEQLIRDGVPPEVIKEQYEMQFVCDDGNPATFEGGNIRLEARIGYVGLRFRRSTALIIPNPAADWNKK